MSPFKLLLICFLCLLSIKSFSADKLGDNTVQAEARHYLEAQPGDLIYGSKDAKNIVVEYFSLTCYHCAAFYENTFLKIKKDYIDTGKVRWIKRSFISDGRALFASLILGCQKSDQASESKLLHVLLSKQTVWVTGANFEAVLKNIARLSGMSDTTIDGCLNDISKKEEYIEATSIASKKLGVAATPFFFINGKPMEKGFDFTKFADYLVKE
jgi:protein-disulfide isomerase